VSGEAILSAENSGNPLGGRAPNSAGELTALDRSPSLWGGVAAPPQKPHHAVGLRPFGLVLPVKNPGHAPELN